MRRSRQTFADVIAEAIADVAEHGFDSEERLLFWTGRLREAAERVASGVRVEDMMREGLSKIYMRLVQRGGLARLHQGAGRFTIQRVAPRLRSELDRRIMASAQLIRLNKQEAVEKTMRRLQGWITSIPAGGSEQVDQRAVRTQVAKPLRALPYEERRVLIDQGHKLSSSISAVVATDGGAIAAKWRSHWKQANYDYREDHKERDEHVYLIRGSWAHEKGLVKPGKDGFTDEITQPAEEIFCRCHYIYIYGLRSLPEDMVSDKGRAELVRVRRELAA